MVCHVKDPYEQPMRTIQKRKPWNAVPLLTSILNLGTLISIKVSIKMKMSKAAAAFILVFTVPSLILVYLQRTFVLHRMELLRDGGPSPSSPAKAATTLGQALSREFGRLESKLIDTASSDEGELRNASCVLIGTSQPNYRYAPHWIAHHRAAAVPFIHFTTGGLARHGRKLAPHYGRIFALTAAHNVLPRVRTFVYTDMDVAVNFDNACKLDMYPMAISWKHPDSKVPFKVILRTSSFVVNPTMRNTNTNSRSKYSMYKDTPGERLLRAWMDHARNVFLQDQTVLNELYRDDQWARDNIHLLRPKKTSDVVESDHCGSYMPPSQRDACIRRIHDIPPQM